MVRIIGELDQEAGKKIAEDHVVEARPLKTNLLRAKPQQMGKTVNGKLLVNADLPCH